MSNQPPSRPWFSLASISRRQPAPGPEPAPAVAPQPRPPVIARPTLPPVAPPQEPTLTPFPPEPVTAAKPAVISPPRAQPPTVAVTAPPRPQQQPTEITASLPRAPPAIRVPSVPSSPTLRPTAPTVSFPQPFTALRQSPPSPKKEVTAPQVARGMPPTSTPARKDLSPKSASSSASSTSARSSPEVVKPAAQIPSSKFKLTAVPPPPPLMLPPSQIRAGETEPRIPPVAEQQKTVLVQKTVEKPKPAYNQPFKPTFARNGKKDVSRAAEAKEKPKTPGKNHSDPEDGSGVTIIKIAGDSTGAVMDLTHPPNKHGFMGNPRFLFDKRSNLRHKIISDGSESESSSSEGKSKSRKDKSHKENNTNQSLPMSAYINSNVQGINSSIACNSACSYHDPGVHLALTKKPADG